MTYFEDCMLHFGVFSCCCFFICNFNDQHVDILMKVLSGEKFYKFKNNVLKARILNNLL